MTDLKMIREKLQDKTIMFVDDEDGIRESTGRFLKKFSNNVIIAKDGQEALDKYTDVKNIDVLITDVLMPNMNGIDLAKKINNIDESVLIIFVTASRNKEKYDGVKNYFTTAKPLSFDVVENMLLEITKRIG